MISGTYESIVCGSCVTVVVPSSYTVSYTGLELVATKNPSTAYIGFVFKVTAAAGEVATITTVYND